MRSGVIGYKRRLGYALVVLVGLLSFSSCGASKRVERRSHDVLLSSSRVEVVDSTRHRYELSVLKYYSPEGVISREEVKQRGELSQVVQVVRDTIYVYERDTTYLEKRVEVGVGRGGCRSWFWCLVVGVMAMGVVVVIRVL